MTPDQIDQLKKSLSEKGFTEEQINVIVQHVSVTPDVLPPVNQIDPIEHFVVKLLENPAIQSLLDSLISAPDKEAKHEKEEQERLFSFLKSLDIRQKFYNISFMIFGCAVVFALKHFCIFGAETATALATLIIGASLTDAISTYMKSQKND